MTTPFRAEINRANSLHSTGPKTIDGKKISSLNALRHGLSSQIVVLPTEDPDLYQSHLKSFHDEYRPQGPTETHLVQSMADTSWRLDRVAALETDFLAGPETMETKSKALSNLSLHSQRLSRQFERTVTQLRDLQKSRRAEEQRTLANLLSLIQMHKDKGEIYDPSLDGFVFSESQIAAALHSQNLEKRISEAHTHRSRSAAS